MADLPDKAATRRIVIPPDRDKITVGLGGPKRVPAPASATDQLLVAAAANRARLLTEIGTQLQATDWALTTDPVPALTDTEIAEVKAYRDSLHAAARDADNWFVDTPRIDQPAAANRPGQLATVAATAQQQFLDGPDPATNLAGTWVEDAGAVRLAWDNPDNPHIDGYETRITTLDGVEIPGVPWTRHPDTGPDTTTLDFPIDPTLRTKDRTFVYEIRPYDDHLVDAGLTTTGAATSKSVEVTVPELED